MSKRVRISNDSLNSYGTRVLTSGMNVEQYCRNPVLLYQHERGQVIGYVKDLKVENDEVTGELMFDCASELSKVVYNHIKDSDKREENKISLLIFYPERSCLGQ